MKLTRRNLLLGSLAAPAVAATVPDATPAPWPTTVGPLKTSYRGGLASVRRYSRRVCPEPGFVAVAMTASNHGPGSVTLSLSLWGDVAMLLPGESVNLRGGEFWARSDLPSTLSYAIEGAP